MSERSGWTVEFAGLQVLQKPVKPSTTSNESLMTRKGSSTLRRGPADATEGDLARVDTSGATTRR